MPENVVNLWIKKIMKRNFYSNSLTTFRSTNLTFKHRKSDLKRENENQHDDFYATYGQWENDIKIFQFKRHFISGISITSLGFNASVQIPN